MTDKLNLQEIVDALAEKEGITKKLAETIVKEFSDTVTEGLEKEGMVKVRGLGTFRLKRVARRMGRNLQTGEPIEIPPHNKVTFTPEKQLKERVNEDYQMLTYKELPTPPPPSAKKEEKIEEKPTIPPPAFEKKKEETPKPPPAPKPSPSPTPSPTPTPKPVTPPPPPPKKTDDDKEGKRKKRGFYWIIPVVIIIVALLLILFYFRACREEAQEPVQPPVQEEVITPAEPEPAPDEKPVVPETKPEPQKPEETIYTLQPGNYLYQLSGFFYGDSLFWVLIYKANADKIKNPEIVDVGGELVIPNLEGDRYNLTRNDSLNLSEGYRMLYEYYNSIDHPAAKRFYFGMKRYQPD